MLLRSTIASHRTASPLHCYGLISTGLASTGPSFQTKLCWTVEPSRLIIETTAV